MRLLGQNVLLTCGDQRSACAAWFCGSLIVSWNVDAILISSSTLAQVARELGVSVASLHGWKRRIGRFGGDGTAPGGGSIEGLSVQQLAEENRRPRMTVELRDRGFAASENRVARIMRVEGIRATPKRAYRPKTTIQDADGSNRIAPNLLSETGKPNAPGQALVTDITYVATREGWLYLAVVLDLFSRCVIGWSIWESLATPLAASI
jgi:transposase InsO family protein